MDSSESSEDELDQFLQDVMHRSPKTFNKRRFFTEISDKEFREKFRVPREVLDTLTTRLTPHLQQSQRNHALSPLQQVGITLHFLGTHAFYHDIGSVHGVSKATVCTVVKRVAQAIVDEFGNEAICWPNDLGKVVQEFHQIAGFPAVIGAVDGSKIRITPPKEDEEAYLDRKQHHSLNLTIVSGPNYEIYFCNTNCSGRWHDSRVLQHSNLWQEFEVHGNLPFPGAVILGDSAYPCRSWLIPPFRGDVEGAKLRFNQAHAKSRCVVERCFGILKKRFYALAECQRVLKPSFSALLIQCACILHSMCIRAGDDAADMPEVAELPDYQPADQEELAGVPQHEQRRQQLLQSFIN